MPSRHWGTSGSAWLLLGFDPDGASCTFLCHMCQEGGLGKTSQARSHWPLPQDKADFPEGQTLDNNRLNQGLLREPVCLLSSGGLRFWQAVPEAGSQQPTPRAPSQGFAGTQDGTRVACPQSPSIGAGPSPAMDTLWGPVHCKALWCPGPYMAASTHTGIQTCACSIATYIHTCLA